MPEQLETFIIKIKMSVLGGSNLLRNEANTWDFGMVVTPVYLSYIPGKDGKLLFTHSYHHCKHFNSKEAAQDHLADSQDKSIYEITPVPTEAGYVDIYKTKNT